MIKGLEAMVIESFTSARAYGVEDAVVASLAETFPGIDWERQATYFFQRVRPARAAAGRGDARGGRRPCARRGSSRGRRGARRSARRPWPISPMRARSASAARSPPIGGSTPTRSWRPGAAEASDPSGRGGGSGLATHALRAAIGRRRCAGGPSCAGDCVDQRRRVVVGAHVGARRGLGESPAGWRPALLPPQFPAPIGPPRDDEHRQQQDDQPKANVEDPCAAFSRVSAGYTLPHRFRAARKPTGGRGVAADAADRRGCCGP